MFLGFAWVVCFYCLNLHEAEKRLEFFFLEGRLAWDNALPKNSMSFLASFLIYYKQAMQKTKKSIWVFLPFWGSKLSQGKLLQKLLFFFRFLVFSRFGETRQNLRNILSVMSVFAISAVLLFFLVAVADKNKLSQMQSNGVPAVRVRNATNVHGVVIDALMPCSWYKLSKFLFKVCLTFLLFWEF